jgi:predicted amidophosphoribosyltransferase
VLDLLDLVLPLTCGGCGVPATRWCATCAGTLRVADDQPHLVTVRHDPGVPVFALGRYAGPRRHAVVALKEHGRSDLLVPLSRVLALGVHRLLSWGIVGLPLAIVPAPTRRSSARRRGGDPVTRLIAGAVAGHDQIVIVPALRMKESARDSVGLNGRSRERNITGRVLVARQPPIAADVLLVDDIVTTGATASESVRVLRSAGADVAGVLALAHA